MAIDDVSEEFKSWKSPQHGVVIEYMAIERNVFLKQRELIQREICALLEGIDESILENVCRVIVERFDILESETDY